MNWIELVEELGKLNIDAERHKDSYEFLYRGICIGRSVPNAKGCHFACDFALDNHVYKSVLADPQIVPVFKQRSCWLKNGILPDGRPSMVKSKTIKKIYDFQERPSEFMERIRVVVAMLDAKLPKLLARQAMVYRSRLKRYPTYMLLQQKEFWQGKHVGEITLPNGEKLRGYPLKSGLYYEHVFFVGASESYFVSVHDSNVIECIILMETTELFKTVSEIATFSFPKPIN